MKIAIDMGHCVSGYDLGARSPGIKEESLTREVGREIVKKLQSMGHTVVDCTKETSYSVSESLSYRANKANANNTELFISIHFNAGGGNGTEIYTYKGRKLNSARNILNNMSKLGFRNRGVKDGAWIYVVRRTKCPAMLIEICFLDNKKDMELYKTLGKNAIAEAIVQGLELEDLNSKQDKDTVEITPMPEYRKNTMILRLQKQLNIQFNSKLVEDGILGPRTLAALVIVRKGAKGEITKIIQETLLKKQYNLGSSGVDGVFGQFTENAVKAFQKNKNLVADGIVGINTWKALLD
ncbi:N-acetylmuramoyl-L-alanine amidase [Clostridium sp. KNHs214]|uniref:N-acetylmuramoyl-L-alanine amidase n=1 Tax=Clostridium sp. KNHs214 TaxID=1540257 RepID=UPI000558AB0C|nr:N-acetylmuramoyl-L-alanine amidase [Clostridium sp. KNHs214]